MTAEHGPEAVWLACSHGDVIKAIVADALGVHLDLFQRIVADPASVTVIRYTPLRPFLVRLNDTGGDLAALVPPPRKRRRRATRGGRLGRRGRRRRRGVPVTRVTTPRRRPAAATPVPPLVRRARCALRRFGVGGVRDASARRIGSWV